MKRRVLVAGARGQLARSLAALAPSDFHFVALGRPELDLTDDVAIQRALAAHAPVAVVNAGAYTAVDQAEHEPQAAFAVNRDGAAALAAASARIGVPVVQLSTDYVFSGTKGAPYDEADIPAPLGIYGRSKREGEKAVAAANPAHVILRTGWLHGATGTNFVRTMLRLAEERDVVRVVADQRGTPTFAPHVASGIAVVLRAVLAGPDDRGWRGVFHIAAAGEASRAEFAAEVFRRSAERGGPHARVEPIATADYPTPARRPADSRLATARLCAVFGHRLPDWREGVGECVAAILAKSA